MRLVIADDHPLFRIGLRYALEASGFSVVAEAGDGAEALQAMLEHKADVALLDVKMPEVDGIEAAKHIRQQLPDCLIILLTTFEEEALIHAARQAGVNGFFSKETSPTDLARAIHAIHAQPYRDWLPTVSLPELTRREQQVLALLGQGFSNKDMARHLSLSPETIKSYLANLYSKLEVSDRLSAVSRGRTLGLIA